jgi:hypothetical protein
LIEHRDRNPPEPMKSITNEQVIVRIYGDTAVVTGVQTAVGYANPPQPFRTLFMNVWHLINGKWVIIGGSRKML